MHGDDKNLNSSSLSNKRLIWHSFQVRYAATHLEPAKSARARGAYLRVSFKNTRETAQAINGWKLQRAVTYLENVMGHKEAVPMRRYAGSTGRTAQGEATIISWRRRRPSRSWDWYCYI